MSAKRAEKHHVTRHTTAGAAQRHRRRKHKHLLQLLVCLVLFIIMVGIGWLIGNGLRFLQNVFFSEKGIYHIAVDAGHGGADTGAIGVIQETEMTELTAELLYNLLADDPNYSPFFTRSDFSVSATPTERAEVANHNHADLLISIHGNAASDPSVRGFECYPVVPGRTQHKESLRFGKMISEQMKNADVQLRGTEGIRYAYYDENDQKILVDGSDDRIRMQSSFSILEKSKCPAVLVEQCFVTNPEDVAQYAGDNGCSLCADLYYRAICSYFKTTPYPEPASEA